MTEGSAEIRRVFDAYKAAVLAKDVDAYIALYDDGVRIFDMWQQWLYRGTPGWRGAAEGWFGSLGSERVVVDADDLNIRVGGDLASLDGFVTFTARSAEGADLRSLTERLTWVLGFADGQWKIVHQHSSAPLDFKTAKAIFSREQGD